MVKSDANSWIRIAKTNRILAGIGDWCAQCMYKGERTANNEIYTRGNLFLSCKPVDWVIGTMKVTDDERC